MIKLDLDEMKSIEIGILDAFHQFCEENGLEYALAGGTMIGAVRHRGFIPWDDDIDIVMPREHYNALLKLESAFPYPYKIKSIYTEKNKEEPYIYSYIKIVDVRTRMLEEPDRLRYPTSVYIDIFPVDGVPKNRIKRKILYQVSWLLINIGYNTNSCVYRERVRPKEQIGVVKRVLYNGLRALRKTLPANFFFILCDRFCQKYDFQKCELIAPIMSGWQYEALPKRALLPVRKIEFEGKTYMAWNDFDLYLRTEYGDYMQLPPSEKRVLAHNNIAWWNESYDVPKKVFKDEKDRNNKL